MIRPPPRSSPFPFTTLFRSRPHHEFDRAPYFEGCLPIEELAERGRDTLRFGPMKPVGLRDRSEEHTSELQSRLHLVCRLLLEKKKMDNAALLSAVDRATDRY